MSKKKILKPWYKSAIFYEISLKAFKDGSGNGIGDFVGLTQKLDYLHNLGIDCIWILPFYPSPWCDDGYDVSDYCGIHPVFGTMSDWEILINEAHKREIRVIIDLIINHSSDKHPWFVESKSSINSPKRDYYVWSDTDSKYKDVRIIFKDTESSNWTYDLLTNQFYWHRFYSHQPDLNFENIKIQEEMLNIIKFWLDKGLDGFRIDAVPYLFEEEDTSCESLPRTHEYIRKIRKFIDNIFGKDTKILLAEANQMAEETIPYFGNGNDEFHMAFHFPLMPRIYLALAKGDGEPIKEIIEQTNKIPSSCQWCTFLRNHDELTLEMVTDEVRELLWDHYAPISRMRLNLGIRRRLAPLLDNNPLKIKLLNSLLFTLPGSPIIYYGDEIGMGDNIHLPDRDGVRTPMQWSNNNNAGFSSAAKDQLYLPIIEDETYGPKYVNVEDQLKNPDSLLNFHKQLIKTRKTLPSLAYGNIHFLETESKSVLAFIRETPDERTLIMHNLSDSSNECIINDSRLQYSELIHVFPGNQHQRIMSKEKFKFYLSPLAYSWWKVVDG